MAFKYQALNESHSSLNSLSSLGSSKSIDSPGAGGGGGGRQRPRLEFSAAGTCGVKRRNSQVAMTEAAVQSVSCSSRQQQGGDSEGTGVAARSESHWRQSVKEREKTMAEKGGTAATTGGNLAGNTTSKSTALVQKSWDSTDSSKEPNLSAESVESETGLYIHSSVRSGASGLKFSRQVSASGDGQTRLPLHQHNHNQRSEHGKLFRALQKFSNKRAQQRVEIESEKRAKKSSPHHHDRSARTGSERGREKENVGHHQRSTCQKNKQGKKWGRFPVSKSSDRLSTFSDVVFRDHSSSGEFDSPVESDTLIYANTTNERLLGSGELESQGLPPLSHVHHGSSSRGHKHRSMPPFYEVEDYDGAGRPCTSASVRRAHSLNGGVYYGCAAGLDTGVLPTTTGVTSLSRSSSAKKKSRYLL